MSCKKCVYTLNIDNYAPEITALTYPLLMRYAEKIGAEFYVIKERKFSFSLPPAYEKLQIYKLGKEMGNDWNIYIDSDALVHPDFFDPTEIVGKETVLHNGADLAGNRWKYDNYFRRDGRHISSCNWLAIASDWCLDLWHPLDDMTIEQALENIYPLNAEANHNITREHLLDDYILSRNIAKYGLKFTTVSDLLEKIGRKGESYFYHEYTITRQEKVVGLTKTIEKWGLTGFYETSEDIEGIPNIRVDDRAGALLAGDTGSAAQVHRGDRVLPRT